MHVEPHVIGLAWLIAAFLVGLFTCFFGYRLFMVLVAAIGLVVGATFGYEVGIFFGSQLAALIIAIILGLLGAWASVMGYYAFIFIFGGFAFAFLAAFLFGLTGGAIPVLLLIIIGIIGGFISIWLQRFIIIFATAAQGALSSVFALAAMFSGGGIPMYRRLFYRLINGEFPGSRGPWFYVAFLAWLVIFGLGLWAQFTRGREMYRRRSPVPVP
jgi:hypothetical protein